MITLEDDDVVGLVTVTLDTAETIMESLVRNRFFDRMDVEWFLDDVEASIRRNVHSELARHVLTAKVGRMAKILQDPELVRQW